MQRTVFYLFLTCLLVPVTLLRANRPDLSEIMARIEAMGDEDFHVRQAASERMREWSEAYPRYLLTAMAEAYADQKDMEIVIRLEELMEPLARRWVLNMPSGFIGINMGWETRNGKSGVSILNVLDGHAAANVGLQAGDMILAVNGTPVSELQQLEGFSEKIASFLPGTIIELTLLRRNDEFVQLLQLGSRPDQRARPNDARETYAAWLLKLKSEAADFDPTFPVGHFPMED
ncbi:MAG: PDZ domain-containing protein [Verrucomicrobia bacterium]|nr:PDZ domain-containing protein [Verrucomicrobiota bacterium]MCH8512090.1 PDZ domain-containing protein [Kiritimatiellia bacterium]